MTALLSSPAKHPLTGIIRVPGDKSISHRALMLSSQAVGRATIEGLLEGEDVLATATALQALGVPVQRETDGRWIVDGVGTGALTEPATVLDMGNAGTGARLMMGLLATHPFLTFFTGDASLSGRPMGRVIAPLSEMGAQFIARQDAYLPLALRGADNPRPLTYRLPVASAQVKSAILLAALNTPGTTTVIEPRRTRDHTERMLRGMGAPIETETTADGEHAIHLTGPVELHRTEPVTLTVPADPSSAAFPIVAALITPDSAVTVPDVCMNPLRTGVFDTLRDMGAHLTVTNEREIAGEPVADITASYSPLQGIHVPAERAPSMIDEYPVLAIAAAVAHGETRMEGLAELKVKESDRLAAIADGLDVCGVVCETGEDWLRIQGSGGNRVPGGGTVTTHLDHRIAMSFLVLGLTAASPVRIDDGRAIDTSFPGFATLMNDAGAAIAALVPRNQQGYSGPERRATRMAVAAAALPVPPAQFRPLVIAIDGPAASGKGTVARRLSDFFGYAYLDTGSLYRATALKLLSEGRDPHDTAAAVYAAESLSDQDYSDPRLRQEAVGEAASVISAIPEVRAALLAHQRNFATHPGGAILDGRDIGTVVCPDADVKLFVDASLEARARRRHAQLQGQGIVVVYESVLHDLAARDTRDRERSAAPLKPADTAVRIDTSDLSITEVFERIRNIVLERAL